MTDARLLLDWLTKYATGRESAVTAEKVARCLSTPSETWTARKVGRVTRELREAGSLVLTAYDEDPMGYYVPATRREAEEWADKEESRAVKTLQAVRWVRESAKELEGEEQMSLLEVSG